MTTLPLVLVLALAPQAAETPTPQAQLADGIRQLEEGDLAAALVTLQDAVERLAEQEAPARDRALGHLYLGMAQLGLGQEQDAEASVREAWTWNKGEKLDARRFPPRVVRLYERVGQELRAQARPKTAARPALLAVPAAAGLAAGLALAANGGEAPAAAPPLAPAPRPVSLRLYNCDDACSASIGGTLVREVAIGEDSGPLDVSARLQPGSNEIVFELFNHHGGIAYGFEVRVGDSVVFQQSCGQVYRSGCDNDQKFPPGVVRRFSYTLER
jgi:hypothetical protein